MLAFGAGGLDVAVAMGGGEYHITMPTMTKIVLTGALSPWVSAKDIILGAAPHERQRAASARSSSTAAPASAR